jgi:hypothetical protein
MSDARKTTVAAIEAQGDATLRTLYGVERLREPVRCSKCGTRNTRYNRSARLCLGYMMKRIEGRKPC